MSKKDFVAIAAAIKADLATTADITDIDRRHTAAVAMRQVAVSLCNVFVDANPRFDRARFLAACGL